MDSELKTSFIPKRRGESRNTVAQVKRPMTIYSLVATVIFVIALALAAAGFFYERYLLSQNNERKLQIQEEIKAFDPELTVVLTDIKSRIDVGQDLLESHLSISMFLSALQTFTLQSIFLEDFSFSASDRQNIEISVKGIAPSYMALAYQSDVLKNSDFIKNLAFSDVNLNEEGKVVFSLKASLTPDIVSFKNEPEATPPATAVEEEEGETAGQEQSE